MKFLYFVYDVLKKFGVELYCVLFFVVMVFYKIFIDDNFLCFVGFMFVYIKNMLFKEVEDVLLVLSYCKDDENFLENLLGLFLFVI